MAALQPRHSRSKYLLQRSGGSAHTSVHMNVHDGFSLPNCQQPWCTSADEDGARRGLSAK